MRMKKISSLVLPLAALLFTASCTDGNYDLSDIDTNSRFYVNGLTVPVNMDPVKLDLMLDIADDSDIKTDEEGNYYFKKEGTFESDPIKVEKITLAKPTVDFDGKVSINIHLDEETENKLKTYAGSMTISQILANQSLMDLIGITPETEILKISFDESSSVSDIKLTAKDIDKSVRSIDKLGLDATILSIKVVVNGLNNTIQPFTIKGLELTLPKGFDATAKTGTTYDAAAGTLKPNNGDLYLDNYTADLSLSVKGINYAQMADGKKVFDAEKHEFNYTKSCAAKGSATLKFKDLKGTATYADIEALEKNGASYECNIGFSHDLAINSFDGTINYSMDDIKVDPVKISNIPDILKESGTNIDLRNPQIYLDITNSLNEYGIGVNSNIEIKGNNTITAPLNINVAPKTSLVMSPLNENLYHATGYTHEAVPTLGTVVGSADGKTFPEELNIRVVAPQVPDTELKKTFELGKDLPGVNGNWEFYTRLTLTDNTVIKYTKEWDDWSDKDLDGLTVESATVNVNLQKDVKLDAESIEFILKGTKGELRGETKLMGAEQQPVEIKLAGEPVSGITGGKLNVRLKGMNGDLSKNQEIKISNLKVTVKGYYDREL